MIGKAPVTGTAENIAQELDARLWQRLSAGRGTKGERLHDWAYLELADLEADEYGASTHGLWSRGLLIRRHIADGEMAYFITWCPAGTTIEALAAVEGHRWRPRTASRPPRTSWA
jgi:SRSO17 transposase